MPANVSTKHPTELTDKYVATPTQYSLPEYRVSNTEEPSGILASTMAAMFYFFLYSADLKNIDKHTGILVQS
jgi:hypothetical protein